MTNQPLFGATTCALKKHELFGFKFGIYLASPDESWPSMTPSLLQKSPNQHIENNHGFLSWTRYWVWSYKIKFNWEVLLFECYWIDLNTMLKDSVASKSLSNSWIKKHLHSTAKIPLFRWFSDYHQSARHSGRCWLTRSHVGSSFLRIPRLHLAKTSKFNFFDHLTPAQYRDFDKFRWFSWSFLDFN